MSIDEEVAMELRNIQSDNNNHERRYKWVKSHVDDIEERAMSLEEKTNQRADDLATIAREDVREGLLKLEKKTDIPKCKGYINY